MRYCKIVEPARSRRISLGVIGQLSLRAPYTPFGLMAPCFSPISLRPDRVHCTECSCAVCAYQRDRTPDGCAMCPCVHVPKPSPDPSLLRYSPATSPGLRLRRSDIGPPSLRITGGGYRRASHRKTAGRACCPERFAIDLGLGTILVEWDWLSTSAWHEIVVLVPFPLLTRGNGPFAA